mmetsp:Transcript_708/g.1477  ORF Transcript_708/g.1477 Transcript_708/m.1477 type:complete len:207 (+) Transcript_708:797-1417(+)
MRRVPSVRGFFRFRQQRHQHEDLGPEAQGLHPDLQGPFRGHHVCAFFPPRPLGRHRGRGRDGEAVGPHRRQADEGVLAAQVHHHEHGLPPGRILPRDREHGQDGESVEPGDLQELWWDRNRDGGGAAREIPPGVQVFDLRVPRPAAELFPRQFERAANLLRVGVGDELVGSPDSAEQASGDLRGGGSSERVGGEPQKERRETGCGK